MEIATNQQENQFWLQIMGDHAIFILNALSPEETNEVEKARAFIKRFDSLLDASRKPVSGGVLARINEEAYAAAQEIRRFILQLIKKQLMDNVIINWTPAYMNHLVNETEEYLNILWAFMQNKALQLNPVHLDILWLMDGMRHAVVISDNMEFNTFDRLRAEKFENEFKELYIRSLEMEGLLRTALTDFPALRQLNAEAEAEMKSFAEFLVLVGTLIKTDTVMNRMPPFFIDHTYREACYYLTNLARVSQITSPACDPGRPRSN